MLHDTSYRIVLRRDKVKSDGNIPIYIRVTKHRKTTYFSLADACLESEWNEKDYRLWETKPRITEKERKTLPPIALKELEAIYSSSKVNPNAKRINARIDDTREKIEQAERDLKTEKAGVSLKKIRLKITDEKAVQSNFLDFYKERIETVIRAELSYNTYRCYLATYNKLIDHQKGKALLFEDVTESYLETLYLKMLKEKYKPSTIKKHFKWMNAIWKRARKKRMVNVNPFEDLTIKSGQTEYRDRLTVAEINKIIELKLSGRLDMARNIFLFAFFHGGIRISDMLKLKWQYIQEGRIKYTMKKSKKGTDMILHPLGVKILEGCRRKAAGTHDYVFDLLENNLDETTDFFERQIQSKTAMINKSLKAIALTAGISKKLTSHISRHSFGGLAMEANVNAFDLSYILMHSKMQTSETYAGGANSARQDRILDQVYSPFVKKAPSEDLPPNE
ncbi:MAG: site-specific integrase [Chitinophagaceae bacterium]